MNSATGLYFIYFIFLFYAIPAESSPSIEELNEMAVNAYHSGNYQKAIVHWKEIFDLGNSDPDLFFNIGNAESIMGNIPQALLFYEKASRFKPSDSFIRNAIKEDRNKIENAVIAVRPFFLNEWIKVFLTLMSPGVWALSGMLLLVIALAKWLFSLNVIKANKILFSGAKWMYISLGTFLFMISLFSYQHIHRKDEGIVFSSCELKQGPSMQSPQIRFMSPGEKVRIIDEITGWYKVNLLNLDEGWLKNDCLKIIDVRENT